MVVATTLAYISSRQQASQRMPSDSCQQSVASTGEYAASYK
ncbi:hypothetical protein N9L68_04285 [bacterium]|nr:hypothetical protein [bacterium]